MENKTLKIEGFMLRLFYSKYSMKQSQITDNVIFKGSVNLFKTDKGMTDKNNIPESVIKAASGYNHIIVQKIEL